MDIETKFKYGEYIGAFVAILILISLVGGKMYYTSTLKRITYNIEASQCDGNLKTYIITDCLEGYPLSFARNKFGPTNTLECGVFVETISDVCSFRVLSQSYQD
jgi:hypothetical protein